MLEGRAEWKNAQEESANHKIGKRISPIFNENSEKRVIFRADLSDIY